MTSASLDELPRAEMASPSLDGGAGNLQSVPPAASVLNLQSELPAARVPAGAKPGCREDPWYVAAPRASVEVAVLIEVR